MIGVSEKKALRELRPRTQQRLCAIASQMVKDPVVGRLQLRKLRDSNQIPSALYHAWLDISSHMDLVTPGATIVDKQDRVIGMVNQTNVEVDRTGHVQYSPIVSANLLLPASVTDLDAKEVMGRDHRAAKEVAFAENMRRMDSFPPPPLEPCEVVYVVGNAPSLKINGHLLTKIRRGAVITVNAGLRLLPNLTPRFHHVLEPRARRDWFDGMDLSMHNLVMDATASPWVADLGWGNVWWSAPAGRSWFGTMAVEKDPNVMLLHHGMTTSFSAIHLAMLLQPKVLVLVGMDCCFTDGEVHPNEQTDAVNRLIEDVDYWTRKKVLTTKEYKQFAHQIAGALVLMKRERPDLRFINASERGLIGRPYSSLDGVELGPEMVPLAEVIEEYEQ